jgi:hypothetical protein
MFKTLIVVGALAVSAQAEIAPKDSVLFFDFSRATTDLGPGHRALRITRAKWGRLDHDPMQSQHGAALEFTNAVQSAEVDLSKTLDGASAVTIGG